MMLYHIWCPLGEFCNKGGRMLAKARRRISTPTRTLLGYKACVPDRTKCAPVLKDIGGRVSIASKSKAPSEEQVRDRLRQHLQNAQGHTELSPEEVEEAVAAADVQVALWFRGSPISLLKCV